LPKTSRQNEGGLEIPVFKRLRGLDLPSFCLQFSGGGGSDSRARHRVSYETIRVWVSRFGVQFAAKLQLDRLRPADKWHFDEVVIPIKGKNGICPAECYNSKGRKEDSYFGESFVYILSP
jgi:hypothetical protein